jgi:hypothetical protein
MVTRFVCALLCITNSLVCMDILEQVPQEMIEELSREGIRRLKDDLEAGDVVRLMNIGCELAYEEFVDAMHALKNKVHTSEQAAIYVNIIRMYRNKCVLPHLAVYKKEVLNTHNSELVSTLFKKRIRVLSKRKRDIESILLESR